ncbi:hypothetical protein [Synechococcus phage S-B68]|nr:hypothetical protein [Synechococcus phage S-B68]
MSDLNQDTLDLLEDILDEVDLPPSLVYRISKQISTILQQDQ